MSKGESVGLEQEGEKKNPPPSRGEHAAYQGGGTIVPGQ